MSERRWSKEEFQSCHWTVVEGLDVQSGLKTEYWTTVGGGPIQYPKEFWVVNVLTCRSFVEGKEW